MQLLCLQWPCSSRAPGQCLLWAEWSAARVSGVPQRLYSTTGFVKVLISQPHPVLQERADCFERTLNQPCPYFPAATSAAANTTPFQARACHTDGTAHLQAPKNCSALRCLCAQRQDRVRTNNHNASPRAAVARLLRRRRLHRCCSSHMEARGHSARAKFPWQRTACLQAQQAHNCSQTEHDTTHAATCTTSSACLPLSGRAQAQASLSLSSWRWAAPAVELALALQSLQRGTA